MAEFRGSGQATCVPTNCWPETLTNGSYVNKLNHTAAMEYSKYVTATQKEVDSLEARI